MPALVAELNDPLERRVADIERKPRLDLDHVGEAIDRIRRPDLVAAELGPAIRFSQRVEAEVAGLGMETLLPYVGDGYDGRFLAVWVPDEQGHGDALDLLLQRIDLESYPPRGADVVPLHNRVAGLLGQRSRRVYEIVSMMFHTIGAINERLAAGAYGRMADVADRLGESELASELFAPLRRDESAHLGYYRTYARQLRPRLADWQLTIVRALIVHTYAPVGAGCEPDKAPFGEVLLALEENPDEPTIAVPAQEIAQQLLGSDERELPPFVMDSLQDCLGRARAVRTKVGTVGGGATATLDR
jgi:hypothetical protein